MCKTWDNMGTVSDLNTLSEKNVGIGYNDLEFSQYRSYVSFRGLVLLLLSL